MRNITLKRRAILTLFILLLISTTQNLFAATFVIVENNTEINFELKISNSTKNLSASYWDILSDYIAPNEKQKVLSFNRNIGIEKNKLYKFTTELIPTNIFFNQEHFFILNQI